MENSFPLKKKIFYFSEAAFFLAIALILLLVPIFSIDEGRQGLTNLISANSLQTGQIIYGFLNVASFLLATIIFVRLPFLSFEKSEEVAFLSYLIIAGVSIVFGCIEIVYHDYAGLLVSSLSAVCSLLLLLIDKKLFGDI